MNKPNQLFIIGSGFSLKEGIDKGLWDKLKGKFTIGINYSYNYFNATLLTCCDKDFYEKESKKEQFQNLSLIIGKQHKDFAYSSNAISLKCNDKEYTKNLKKGVWKSNLSGVFTLSLGVFLIDKGTIFLLGYDGGGKKRDEKGRFLTHFYQNQGIEHRGIGKIGYYNIPGRADKDFRVYKGQDMPKILNVSLNSAIGVFPKISYDEFFKQLNTQIYPQDELRQWIRTKLGSIK